MEIILQNKFTALDEALYSDKRFVTIRAGRRTGKTQNSAQWIIDEVLSTEAESGLWVDTRHANIDKYVERVFLPVLSNVLKHVNWNQQKKILKLPKGYVDFGSAERAEMLEGFEYDRVVLNESGLILKKESLWDNTLQPMTRSKNNKTRFIGTPKGSKGGFKTLCSRIDPEWQSYHFRAHDSPYWDKDELEKISRNVPELVWKQEYLAEFLEDAGTVFRGISKCYSDKLLTEAEEGRRYVMAFDVAKYQDFTVVYVADLKANQVVFQDRFNQIDWNFQKDRILSIWNRFNKPKALMDSTGVGDAVFDNLKKAGMNVEGFKFNATNKEQIIQNLSTAIDSQAILFYPFTELIAELEIFEYEVRARGFGFSAPEGYHDDCVIALALVNELLSKENNKASPFFKVIG
jgi:hypothetical protein